MRYHVKSLLIQTISRASKRIAMELLAASNYLPRKVELFAHRQLMTVLN